MAEAMLQEDYRSSPLPVLDVVSSSNLKKRGATTTENTNANTNANTSNKSLNQQVESNGANASPNNARKHIVFKIPPKRQKLAPTATIKQVIEAISATVPPYERLHALAEAALSFDHNIESAHDDELAEGAGPVLMKHLAFLLFKRHCLAESIHSRQSQNNNNTSDNVGKSRPRIISNASSEEVQQVANISTEISQTVEVLEMVYRASVSAVSESFNYLGQELLPLLITVIEDELNSRCVIVPTSERSPTLTAVAHAQQKQQDTRAYEEESATADDDRDTNFREQQQQRHDLADDQEAPRGKWTDDSINNEDFEQARNNDHGSRSVTPPSPIFSSTATTDLRGIGSGVGSVENDLTLRKATKIIGHFARVSEATQQIAYHPRLLGSLRNTISFSPFTAVPSEARLNSLWILANLACNSENMVMMACHPGLLQMLVTTLFRTPQEDDSTDVVMQVFRSHSIACRALHNLAWAPANKIPMSENGVLVEALSRMLVQRTYLRMNRPHGTSSILLQTRRHAAGTLRNLAQAPRRNKIRLMKYGCGSFFDTLVDAARNDPDNHVRDKALATIHNLACVDTAEIMIAQPELLSLLKDTIHFLTLQNADKATTTTEQDDTRLEDAQGTLTVLERSITEDMSCYPTLRDLLKELEPLSKDEEDNADKNVDDSEDSQYSSTATP